MKRKERKLFICCFIIYLNNVVCDGFLERQDNYLRDLPLHESQKEAERTEEYSIFEFHLCPTFDFLKEILRNGEDVEIIEPLWLRNEMAGKIN